MPSLLPFLQRSFTIHSDKIIHSKPSSILTTVDFESHLDDHQDPACCHSIDASSTAVNQSTIECKFDIVYSLPWGCPVLYFSIVDDTGMPLSLSEIMLVFNIQSPILDNNDSHRFWNTAISMQVGYLHWMSIVALVYSLNGIDRVNLRIILYTLIPVGRFIHAIFIKQ